jgi:hypothetical protein
LGRINAFYPQLNLSNSRPINVNKIMTAVVLGGFGWILWEALFSWYVLCNPTTLAPRMKAKVRFPSSSFHGMGCGLDIHKEAPHKILASHAPRNKRLLVGRETGTLCEAE